MSSSIVTMLMISKGAKHLSVQHGAVWEQHLCHLENDLVDPSRITHAERARCDERLLSKTHINFKVYKWKWSVQIYCPLGNL